MRILLNLFLFVIPSLCQEETELQCSAKPGCQITQCDQAPLDWTKPGFNVDEHYQRKKFLITCVNKNAGKSQTSGNFLPLITGNIQDIRNVESNLKNIEEKVENNEDNIKGMADLDVKIMEQSTGMLLLREEITDLREITKNQSSEITDLREMNKNQSSEITDLRKMNKNQSLKIEKQSKEINEMRKENKEQSSELKQQSEKMKTQGEVISKQSAAMSELRDVNEKQSREIKELRNETAEKVIEIKQSRKENKEQFFQLEKVKNQSEVISKQSTAINELREINDKQSLESEKQSKEINKIRKENKEQSSELKQQSEKVKNQSEVISKQSTSISELREMNEKQSLEIEKQSRKIQEQSKEINELRKENEEKSSKFKQQIESASDQTQRHVTQCSEDIEALKAEMKNLQPNFIKLIVAVLSTWYNATNGNYYKLFQDRVNYATAKANCERYHGRLASAGIRDDHIRRELIPLLEAGDAYITWVGLNDIEQKGAFYWEDGIRSDASSTPWYGTEPNDSGGREDCVEMVPSIDWKLNDVDCSVLRDYLCEIAIISDQA